MVDDWVHVEPLLANTARRRPVYTAAMERQFGRRPGDNRYPNGSHRIKDAELAKAIGSTSKRFMRLPDEAPYNGAIIPEDKKEFLKMEKDWLEGNYQWKKSVPKTKPAGSLKAYKEAKQDKERIKSNADDVAMFAAQGETIQQRTQKLASLKEGRPYWGALVPNEDFFTRHEALRQASADPNNYWKKFSRQYWNTRA